jgi:hypothetical protein
MRALRIAALAAAGLVALSPGVHPAAADVLVVIDKASQRMSVAVNGRTRHIWPVSTGRRGYGTPSGRFRPQWMARTYFSKKYYDSPMPHSIFFHHGYAIHGTEYINRLGGPASHGCVRLHPRAAATLFALVQNYGMHRTRIIIGDHLALQRLEHWSAHDRSELRFITLMTDRLMLAEQIERKEALARIEQIRASDALRRIVERGGASDQEPAIAIGVQARDRNAVPKDLMQSAPSPRARPAAGASREQPASMRSEREATRRRPPRRVEPKSSRRSVRAEQSRRKVSWSAPGRAGPNQ